MDDTQNHLYLCVTGGVTGAADVAAAHSACARVSLAVQWFISFFRGTPLIAQLFLLYYGSGQFRPWLMEMGLWHFFRDPFNCALLAFTFNSLAYQTEILRGAIQSVDAGEIEAAKSMGMNNSLLYRHIVLPLAYRIAFPALGNECILMLKGGAVASVITVMDLMGQTRRAFSQTFDISTYFLAAGLYLIIATVFVMAWRQAGVTSTDTRFSERRKQLP